MTSVRYHRVGRVWREVERTCLPVRRDDASGRSAVYCSECGSRLRSGVPTRNYRYCPKCGARIEGDDDE